MAHIWRCSERCSEKALVAVPIGRDNFQQKIGLSSQHVSFAHFGPSRYQLLEGLQIGLSLAGEADLSKNGYSVAERFGREISVIAANDAGLFEGADPA